MHTVSDTSCQAIIISMQVYMHIPTYIRYEEFPELLLLVISCIQTGLTHTIYFLVNACKHFCSSQTQIIYNLCICATTQEWTPSTEESTPERGLIL